MPGNAIQTCGTCRFRLPSPNLKSGVCRRHPPQVLLMPGPLDPLGRPSMQVGAMWPSVANDGGCGDGAPMAEIVPLRPIGAGSGEGAGSAVLEYAGGPLTLGDGT
jgi:hypothetical protein